MHAVATVTVREKLAVLKTRFLSELPLRVRAISHALMRLTAGNAGSAELERLFHTLAGTASTYRLWTVAALAVEGEQVCSSAAWQEPDAYQYLKTIVADLHAATAELGE